MTENIWLAIIGIALTVIQALSFYILKGIKSDQTEMKNDQKEIWKRVYGHYHEAECPACTKIRTGNVIVPHEG